MYKLTTHYTSFQLTFKLKVVTPIEVTIPSLRLILPHDLDDSRSFAERLMALEKLDEDCKRAMWNNEVMQNQKKLHHNSLEKKVKFQPGEFVMLVDSWLMM